jgi:two-component system, cell cycle sensor histidine kinase and response regulator CckA
VEDEESVRSLVKEILETRGFKVLVASDGREGLEEALQYNHPIHLLISDLIMPAMNGRELADQLVMTHPETKVLFISGYSNDSTVGKRIADEGVAFLDKPFTAQTLLQRIGDIFQGKTGSSFRRKGM